MRSLDKRRGLYSGRSSGSLVVRLLVVLAVFGLISLARSWSAFNGVGGSGGDVFGSIFAGLSSRFLDVLHNVFVGFVPALSVLVLVGFAVAWRRGYLEALCSLLRDVLVRFLGRRGGSSLECVTVESAPEPEEGVEMVDDVSHVGQVDDRRVVEAIGGLTPIGCRIIHVLMSHDGLTKRGLVELLSLNYKTVLKHVKALEGYNHDGVRDLASSSTD